MDRAPNDIDPVMWNRGVRDDSIMIIQRKKKLPVELTDRILPDSALRFAAVIWVNHELDAGEYEEVEMDKILEGTGYTVSRVYTEVIDAIESAAAKGLMPNFAGKSREDIMAVYDSLHRIPIYHIPAYDILEEAMRADLQALDYQLPELGPDFTYEYDQDEERYSWPEPPPGAILQ
jgi:hypothetical protein